MKECLQEEVLQSYLDGELHGRHMEQVTYHLAACTTCSDVARQLEQENSLLSVALAPEFEVAVPSERLRQRLDAAIGSARIESASANAPVRNWLSSFSDLFTLRPQRALGFASLILIVGFGAMMAMMRWQTVPVNQPTSIVQAPPFVPVATTPTTATTEGSKLATPPAKATTGGNAVAGNVRPPKTNLNSSAPVRGPEVAANHVKLLPGEKSYLQTIAQLDSTIKADTSRMKPEVQAEYQRNLAVVDRTLAVARTAAKSNPNDPDATEFMFSAYQSKVDLLNTVAEARVFDKAR